MPLKVNVGLCRKVGEANYGSRGASINMEMELDSSLIMEPAKLQDRIRQLFSLVRTSLAEELHGGNSNNHPLVQPVNCPPNGSSTGNGNGHTNRMTGQRITSLRQATQSQIKAIYAIAKHQGLDLSSYLEREFQVHRPEDLSIKAASQVIDQLKQSQEQGG